MTPPSAVELGSGSVVADYRIEALWRAGGMSVPYTARQLSLNRRVANPR